MPEAYERLAASPHRSHQDDPWSGELDRAQAAAGALFGGDIGDLDEGQLKDVFADVPIHPIRRTPR